MTDLASGYIMT